MEINEIIAFMCELDDVIALRPEEGDGSPEIAWGDVFFYYAPNGVIPQTQPFATIITKDYPDDTTSRLNATGAFRVNIHAGKTTIAAMSHTLGTAPDDRDVIIVHPVYGHMGWLAIVEPGPHTREVLTTLLLAAHGSAAARHERSVNRTRPGSTS